MAINPARKTRLKEVAADAGVSSATASLILNDKTDAFPASTIDRVRESAARLGYRPNALARSLRSQRTHTIGLISDEIATTPFAGAMIRGAQEAAWKAGHVLMHIDTEGDSEMEQAALEAMLERKVDGLVYARMHHQVVDIPEVLTEVPAVLLDAREPTETFASVVPDERNGARVAVEHLIAMGHTRIGFVQCVDPIPAAYQRLEGFQTALESAGLDYNDRWTVVDPLEPGGHALEVDHLLAGPDRPSALFCFNDRMALGAYNSARRLGLRIPDDLSVVGFDNLETVAPWLDPGLTTVELPHYEMGRWAVDYLERLIDGESLAPEQHLMDCPLIERNSVSRRQM